MPNRLRTGFGPWAAGLESLIWAQVAVPLLESMICGPFLRG